MDVLADLYPYSAHPLYPKACGVVLHTKRTEGAQAAIDKAAEIADRMVDAELLRRIKE